MAANNEVGTLYPIEAATALARQAGTAILVDATQAVGNVPLQAVDWGIDYLALSAHKIYGPKGSGALVAPFGRLRIAELAVGHEGTPNTPAAAGFGEACRLAIIEGRDNQARIRALRDRLETALLSFVPGLVINGDREHRLACNLHVSAPGAPNGAVLARLRQFLAVSTGSACSSGSDAPSHVIRAMRLPADVQDSALRLSVGKFNNTYEIDTAAAILAEAIADVRTQMGTPT
jgi:cysteine desulfurase